MHPLSRRGLLATTIASLAAGQARAADNLVAATFGGTWGEVQKQVLAPYFTKRTGATVSLAVMLATEQIAKLTAAKGGTPPFDVAILDEGPALEAIDAGLVAKYDPAKSPAYAGLLPQFQGEYGPAVTMQAIGIAYNPKTVKTPPTTWDDLWRPEYKGRVGITSLASTLGLAFLLDVNRLAGGTESNMAPGFAKLRTLLPNLAAVSANFGSHGALFQQGEIDIGVQNFNFAEELKAKGRADRVRSRLDQDTRLEDQHARGAGGGEARPRLRLDRRPDHRRGAGGDGEVALERDPDQRRRAVRRPGRQRDRQGPGRDEGDGVLRLGDHQQKPQRLDAAVQSRHPGVTGGLAARVAARRILRPVLRRTARAADRHQPAGRPRP